MKDDSIMCPSNRCKPGSQLLGIRQEDGTVAILPQPLPIDNHFIESTQKHKIPVRQRFRFVNKCIETGCGQWNGKGCGVIENVIQHIDNIPGMEGALPPCGIRNQCRWYMQRKSDACRMCPYILYEVTEEDVLEMQKAGAAIM
jgi:hypothetical protein